MEKTKNKKHFRMRPMIIVLLGFLVVMFVGAFFLALPISNTDGKWMNFTHAVFWAMNGVCGTGLVVTPTSLTFTGFGQAVLLLLIQFGGLGFMTMATFV
ncbi:MAG: Trk family potassium uptake protein, partial [Clostridiales bacterium]|nr:Trk family potassium uptake protein [Clostridiales bacterium]